MVLKDTPREYPNNSLANSYLYNKDYQPIPPMLQHLQLGLLHSYLDHLILPI